MSRSFCVPENDDHLSNVKTMLSRYFKGEQPGDDQFMRYYGAAYRYFFALVREPETAKELTNQFAQRFLAGDFRKFDPAKGRFRDFLKTSLRNMAHNHFRAQRRQALPLAAEDLPQHENESFDNAWQEELLHQAWKSLENRQRESGKPVYTVLRFKTEHPKMRSEQLAEELGNLLGQPLSAANARQIVHRAREAFQEILLDEVTRSLGSTDLERVADELRDLKLWEHCKEAWRRRQEDKSQPGPPRSK